MSETYFLVGKPGTYQGTNTSSYSTQSAQAYKTAAPFHHTFDMLQVFQ
jgi:hypothetical protein